MMKIREKLVGIKNGEVADTHGKVVKLAQGVSLILRLGEFSCYVLGAKVAQRYSLFCLSRGGKSPYLIS